MGLYLLLVSSVLTKNVDFCCKFTHFFPNDKQFVKKIKATALCRAAALGDRCHYFNMLPCYHVTLLP